MSKSQMKELLTNFEKEEHDGNEIVLNSTLEMTLPGMERPVKLLPIKAECIFEVFSGFEYLHEYMGLSKEDSTTWREMLLTLRRSDLPEPRHLFHAMLPKKAQLTQQIGRSGLKSGDLLSLRCEGTPSPAAMSRFATMMNYITKERQSKAVIVTPICADAVLTESFVIEQTEEKVHSLIQLVTSYGICVLPIHLSGNYYFLLIVLKSQRECYVVDANSDGDRHDEVEETVQRLVEQISSTMNCRYEKLHLSCPKSVNGGILTLWNMEYIVMHALMRETPIANEISHCDVDVYRVHLFYFMLLFEP